MNFSLHPEVEIRVVRVRGDGVVHRGKRHFPPSCYLNETFSDALRSSARSHGKHLQVSIPRCNIRYCFKVPLAGVRSCKPYFMGPPNALRIGEVHRTRQPLRWTL